MQIKLWHKHRLGVLDIPVVYGKMLAAADRERRVNAALTAYVARTDMLAMDSAGQGE
jgi:hypothetical protein